MKIRLLWLALIIAVVTAGSLAWAHFEPTRSVSRQFVSPGPLSRGHAYLENRCASCHQTNIGVTAAKCTACHANDERLLGRQPTAFHASIRECRTCHVEHRGGNGNLIAMDHVELARIGARTLARASGTDEASADTLKSLKTWLRIRIPGQLDERSTGEALNCVGCHATKDRHLNFFGKDCAQCHGLTKWTIADFRHPSPRSTDCAQCHQAPPSHYMMHFDMISKKIAGQEDAKVAGCCGAAQANQCYRCHQTTSWNDIRGVGYYKHH
jgi:hypothetical protein